VFLTCPCLLITLVSPGRIPVKFTAVVFALLPAGCLTAQTAPAPPTNIQATAHSSMQVCAAVSDAENLCSWDSPRGTHGRKCTLDVEKIDRNAACHYGASAVADMKDHKPMCFSIRNAEHIAFNSGRGRQFRVRRLVPITAKGVSGQDCPKDPFGTTFDPKSVNFGGSFDSAAPKASARGCKYKLEVQFHDEDPNAPVEPNDPGHHHYECRDPHLLITQSSGS
jgi:hypothetical protein